MNESKSERIAYITVFTKEEVKQLLKLVQGETVSQSMLESLGHKLRGWLSTSMATFTNYTKEA